MSFCLFFLIFTLGVLSSREQRSEVGEIAELFSPTSLSFTSLAAHDGVSRHGKFEGEDEERSLILSLPH